MNPGPNPRSSNRKQRVLTSTVSSMRGNRVSLCVCIFLCARVCVWVFHVTQFLGCGWLDVLVCVNVWVWLFTSASVLSVVRRVYVSVFLLLCRGFSHSLVFASCARALFLPFSLVFSLPHTLQSIHAHTQNHTRTHTHAHTHAHTLSLSHTHMHLVEWCHTCLGECTRRSLAGWRKVPQM